MKYPRLRQDTVYPEMYRVVWAKDDVSDMVNKTRAKDAVSRYLDNKSKIDSRMPAKSN